MCRNDRGFYSLLGVLCLCVSCGGSTDVKIGPPAALSVSAGDAQTGDVATALPANVAAKVADASGHGVPNSPVTWTVVTGGGSVAAVAATTDNTGVAQARWTLGTAAGVQSVTATSTGLTPLTFTATARAGAPAQLEKTAGDGQSVTVATSATTKPTVKVSDRYGNPVSGAIVTWTAAGGTSASSGTSTTDASGLANVTWQMGTTSGSKKLTAAVTGATSVDFNATAVAASATSIQLSPGTTSQEWGNTVQYTMTASDVYGNAVTRTPTWSSSNTNVATISAAGVASTLKAGTTSITATVDGRSGSANLNVTATTMRITVQNLLVASIIVNVNNVAIGTVAANTTKDFTIGAPTSLTFDWDAVRQKRTDGVEIGDIWGGYWDPFAPTFHESFTVDHEVGTSIYFAPFVDNNSSTDWLMGVNMGLQYENRCNCVVTHGAQDVWLGYYKWQTGANVRAFKSTSNYTGTYINWVNFEQWFGTDDGAFSLWSDTALETEVAAGRGQPQTKFGVQQSGAGSSHRADHEKAYQQGVAPRTMAPVAPMR